jgi:predicted homoserine dehydrogenase-like protein
MIIVDQALRQRLHEAGPVRLAMVGAGFMGRALARQIVRYQPAIRLVAICNRHVDGARRACAEAGAEDVHEVREPAELTESISGDRYAVCQDPALVCAAEGVEAVLEVTGSVEFGAQVAAEAIRHGKHVILMNAELGATLGPALKARADEAGVVLTDVDGDQPGVTMNLYRLLTGMGIRPVLCGNVKGLLDPYRSPETQAEFARRWGQSARKVTSFADGTKISCEQALIANATGMRVARRGMLGPRVPPGTPLAEAAELFPTEELLDGPGIVDYVIGAEPAPGVFILAAHDDPVQRRFLSYYKMGDGPLYCFHTPFHLCHFEVPNTVARAVLFGDAAVAPSGAPVVEVVAMAKRDLQAGETLDGIGGFCLYGQCENADVRRRDGLLPIGLAEGCRLERDVARDEVLKFDDVTPPPDRLCDRLYREQEALA